VAVADEATDEVVEGVGASSRDSIEPVADRAAQRDAAAVWADEGGSVATVAEVQQDAPEGVDGEADPAPADALAADPEETDAPDGPVHEWRRRTQAVDDASDRPPGDRDG
jgi:hypothetical protein